MKFEDARWRRQALCLEASPEDFFPASKPTKRVVAMCSECPVRAACLETALSSPWEPIGVWGALFGRRLRKAWRARRADAAAIQRLRERRRAAA